METNRLVTDEKHFDSIGQTFVNQLAKTIHIATEIPSPNFSVVRDLQSKSRLEKTYDSSFTQLPENKDAGRVNHSMLEVNLNEKKIQLKKGEFLEPQSSETEDEFERAYRQVRETAIKRGDNSSIYNASIRKEPT